MNEAEWEIAREIVRAIREVWEYDPQKFNELDFDMMEQYWYERLKEIPKK